MRLTGQKLWNWNLCAAAADAVMYNGNITLNHDNHDVSICNNFKNVHIIVDEEAIAYTILHISIGCSLIIKYYLSKI